MGAKREFRVVAVERDLGDGVLVEVLGFPEISTFDVSAPAAWRRIRDLAGKVLEDDAPLDVHRRAIGGEARVEELAIDLDPVEREAAWETPLPFRFHVVRRDHLGGAQVAFVPALGVTVVGRNPAEVDERLPVEIRSALLRREARGDLRKIVELTRDREVSVAVRSVSARIATPAARLQAYRDRGEEESILEQVADELGRRPPRPAYEVEEAVGRLAEALRDRGGRSVLLVGASGAGKTAIALELVRRRGELGLADRTFWRTSGTRLVAGQTGFGMWQERCQKLVREADRRRAVLLVGGLVELAQVGKSEGNALGIAGFLRPSISRGELVVVAESTPEELAALEREDPALVQAFQRLDVEEPSREKTLAVLLRVATESGGRRAEIDLDGLETIDRLHRRYAAYSARPGRALRFLEGLLARKGPGGKVAARDVTGAFAAETGLPLFLLEDAVRFDPAAAGSWLHSKLVGQDRAVDLVVDLLATAKAALGRPGKPIASLLFIGPTGVGKTEMAKALAEFLFGGRDRLVRFDLSEFADPVSVRRLVGGGFGSEGLLTARIREQPFSVVLLDEFEKADPSLFDLLLQVLGEGRLTDASGRLADFTNSILVLTSNLGSASFGADQAGFVPGAVDAESHFVEAVRSFVRPELYNRIDRIVPFLPLSPEAIAGIARRQIEDVKGRDGVRYRALELEVEPRVAEEIAARAFDSRYGARPIQRSIDRELLAPLARALSLYGADTALRARVGWEGDRAQVEVRSRPEGARPGGSPAAILSARELRRDARRLLRSAAVRELGNRIHELERLAERVRKAEGGRSGRPPAEEDRRRAGGLAPLRELRRALEEFATRTDSIEEEALVRLLSGRPVDDAALTEEVGSGRSELSSRLHDLFAALREEPSAVTVAVYGEDRMATFELASIYLEIARERAWRHRIAEVVAADPPPELRPGDEEDEKGPWLEARELPEDEQSLPSVRAGAYGLVIALAGRFARALLEDERGRHVFEEQGRASTCLVETGTVPLPSYRPPKGVGRKRALEAYPLRRRLAIDQRTLRDEVLAREIRFSGRRPSSAVIEAIEARLEEEVWRLLEE